MLKKNIFKVNSPKLSYNQKMFSRKYTFQGKCFEDGLFEITLLKQKTFPTYYLSILNSIQNGYFGKIKFQTFQKR
jgi:hypothetical protein